MVLLQTRCPFTSLVISNIETTFLPSNTASSLSSAQMLRFSVRHSFRSNNDNQYATRWLYQEAPFCALAHNTDRDPIFIYGNKAAQACFEYTWDELTSLRSRLSAEEPNRQES